MRPQLHQPHHKQLARQFLQAAVRHGTVINLDMTSRMMLVPIMGGWDAASASQQAARPTHNTCGNSSSLQT
jgi:hypothetical protein